MRKFIFLCCLFLSVTVVAQVAPTSYGPTTKSDQLWQIAIMVRPNANVSIEQTMQALLKANPDAFVGNNVNKLKPGMMLKIPSLVEIQQISSGQASQLLSQQTASEHVAANKTLIPHFNDSKKPLSVHDNNKKLQELSAVLQQNNQDIASMQVQFDNVGKALINFDQQYQVRLADLEKHNLALQATIDQLNQKIQSLENNMQTLHQPAKLPQWLAPYVKYMQNLFGPLGFKIFIAIIILLLILIIWLLCPCRRIHKCKSSKKVKNAEQEDDEYDFMGSQEGIPAKLDLARAYIDMGDVDAATQVLNDIIAKGNAEQQAEAKKLLSGLVPQN